MPDANIAVLQVFRSKEIIDLITWIRSFNAAHPSDQVVYFGFDVQQAGIDTQVLRNYTHQRLPSLEQQLQPGWDACGASDGQGKIGPKKQPQYNACIAALDVLKQYTQEHQADLANASASELAVAQIAMTSLYAGAANVFFAPVDYGWKSRTARDAGMAKGTWPTGPDLDFSWTRACLGGLK